MQTSSKFKLVRFIRQKSFPMCADSLVSTTKSGQRIPWSRRTMGPRIQLPLGAYDLPNVIKVRYEYETGYTYVTPRFVSAPPCWDNPWSWHDRDQGFLGLNVHWDQGLRFLWVRICV